MQLCYADPSAFDAAFLQRLTPLLPPEKQQSIAKIRHAPTRRQAVLAWGLLVFALRETAPGEPLPPLGFTQTGKPFLTGSGPQFNLSHTDTLVCLALDDRQVGVDAQTLLTPSDGVAKRVLSPAELALLETARDKAALFTAFWTMKEAYVKRTGEGIDRDLKALDFAPYDGLDRFAAYGCRFSAFRLHGAVMTACGEAEAEPPRPVTQQMLEAVLLSSNHS